MSDDEVLAMLVHLHTKVAALDERLADLEAQVEHMEAYAL